MGISANADTQDVERAREGGMDEFLTKPINIERLGVLLHARFGVSLARGSGETPRGGDANGGNAKRPKLATEA